MRKGGIGKSITTIIWILVIIGVILAVFQQTGIVTIEEAVGKAKSTAAHYFECIPAGECGLLSIIGDIKPSELIINSGGNPSKPKDDNVSVDSGSELILNIPIEERSIPRNTKGYRGPEKGEPYVNNVGIIKKELVKEMLESIEVIDEEKEQEEIKYSRTQWKHWTKSEGSCLNTREEILFRDAKPGTLMFLNKKLEPTVNINEACTIGFIETKDGKRKVNTENSGEWIDPYSGKIMTSSSEIDIDHIVPLSYAAKRGGQVWSAEEKQAFANDPDNLLATSAKENRTKGDKGPDKYMPSAAYRCQYVKTFTSIVYKYGLKITDAELVAIEKALRICQY